MRRRHPVALALGASLTLAALTPAGAAKTAAAKVFRDDFASGEARLDWMPHPLSGGVVVRGEKADAAPDGDGGIGVLRHPGGELPTLSYAETDRAEGSFEIEAFVHCPIDGDGGDDALTGLAFYVLGADGEDEADAGGFYRLVCDYRLGPAAFSLAYLGPNIAGQPLEIERWPVAEDDEEEPSKPAGEGWRKVRIVADQGVLDFYVDGAKVNGRPIRAERMIGDSAAVDAGYAAVYAGHVAEEGTATARVDGFVYRIK